ncbi:MAG: hypothetical protein LBG45_02770 [Dysgonamonadaceae bacterium]|nr:hypothetical protein [Dysgonamonadaceae bacterium]
MSVESDECEPRRKEELTDRYEGSHSLFGFIWQIASATGWTVKYILWGINLQTLQMMLYDAPHYVKAKPAGKKKTGKKQDIAAMFQSRLKDYK